MELLVRPEPPLFTVLVDLQVPKGTWDLLVLKVTKVPPETKGDNGPKGEMGISGPTGEPSKRGPSGEPGPQGSVGQPGERGQT